jgi:hypothetical protein
VFCAGLMTRIILLILMSPFDHGELVTDYEDDEPPCEEETTCEEDELLAPEPDEVEEERRPFSYVNFRVPPLICCIELTLFPAVKATCFDKTARKDQPKDSTPR